MVQEIADDIGHFLLKENSILIECEQNDDFETAAEIRDDIKFMLKMHTEILLMVFDGYTFDEILTKLENLNEVIVIMLREKLK
jgi:excinuclease UvrABC nuclease subunit